jgi:membrane-associated protease RseP (regulator of RpoE activity)
MVGEPGTPGAPDLHDRAAERRKLAMLLGIVTAGFVLAIVNGSFPVVAFMLAIVASVMLHETGHFVTAKLSGMKVTEYFFGFGPRLWSVRKGETEYGVKALPFGGYVKIVGMSNLERDVDPADEARTYRQQSYPRRMAVALAGIVTQFLVAIVLLTLLWSVIGVPRYDKPTLEVASISRLPSGASPALDAGFKVGDRIVSVGGERVARWDDVPPRIRDSAGTPITFVVQRDGRTLELTAVPAEIERDGQKRGYIGIGPQASTEKVSPVVGVGRAGSDLWKLTAGSVSALGSFFAPSSLRDYASTLTHSKDGANSSAGDQRFISVVGVARIAGQAAESGMFNLVYLLVVMNVFIAVFNLVPLLPLDGGHVAIATYERIRSRRGRRYQADVAKMMPIAAAVIVVLVLIGITSVYLDIVRPMANPFQ